MSAGGSGANAYWPGFVDALTNVVIAMIFVVVVLAISLSFAAQMMGKKLAEKYIKEHAEKTAPKPPDAPPQVPLPPAALPSKTHIAVVGAERAASGANSQLRQVNNSLQLDYAAGAMSLDEAAAQRFKEAVTALGKDGAKRRVEIVASGPAMSLSDNQRAAFMRVMAVRNTLLEMGFAAERIAVRIASEVEMPAPTVNVSFMEAP